MKLALLLAVAHEPEVLLLDEPLSGLDPIAREEFLDGVLRTICERGQTVLISSHMLDDVRRLADTVGFLNNGQLLLQDNLDALLASTKRICATLRDGCRPQQNARGHDLAAHRGAGVDRHLARFHAGEARASPGDRGSRAGRASSTWAWRNSLRTSFEGKGWHHEMAVLERLSAQSADRDIWANSSVAALRVGILRHPLAGNGRTETTLAGTVFRIEPLVSHRISANDCHRSRKRHRR